MCKNNYSVQIQILVVRSSEWLLKLESDYQINIQCLHSQVFITVYAVNVPKNKVFSS